MIVIPEPAGLRARSSTLCYVDFSMSVDIETTITDYDWAEKSRPILTIREDRKSACLHVGGFENAPFVEWDGNTVEDLKNQIDGMAELFQAAAAKLAT